MNQNPTLLVVDDSRLDRTIALYAAEKAGYDPIGATGVTEAAALLADRSPIAYVLLDLSLEAEDGLQILHLLASLSPKAIVLFVSGVDSRILASSRRLAMRLGLRVAGALSKPIHPARLRELLDQPPDQSPSDPPPPPEILQDELRQAIADGAVIPWFQPKVSLQTGAIAGAEALARWTRSDGTTVPPSIFVDAAATHGLLEPLTNSILEQSLQACAQWRRTRPDCTVAVNLSPSLLSQADLTSQIDRLLRRYGVPPNALVLEVVEGAAIPDTARVVETLTRLRIWGVNLAIDDFGTGHSSLLALARTPFNEVKIDQTFVRMSACDEESRKIVGAVASLGRALGLKIVVEGIETEAVAAVVHALGCDLGQGWLYGRATPLPVFKTLLAANGKC